MLSTLISTALLGAFVWAQSSSSADVKRGPDMLTSPTAPTTNSDRTSTATGTSRSTNATHATNPSTAGELAQTDLTARIRLELMEDPTIQTTAANVVVENVNGQITLRGKVPSRKVEKLLLKKVKAVSGVSRINNRLTIE